MLRAIDEQDLAPMLAWRNNPKLRQYFREYRDLTVVDQARWFEGLSGDDTRAMFAIWYEGKMVGCCGLTAIDWKNRSAEVSLYIGEPMIADAPVYIDTKVAPLALHDLMAKAYDAFNLHRTWCEVFDFDDKKKALLETAGFDLEGSLRDTHYFDGGFHGSFIYVHTEKEWRA